MSQYNSSNEYDRPANPTRYCKQCGCPLTATSGYDECDDCRRQKADKMKKQALGIGSALLIIGTIIKKISK